MMVILIAYGAGAGWGNVTGGHKQAKNVIAVANLTQISNLAGSSSRGPQQMEESSLMLEQRAHL